jgi:hypothetical protein
MGHSSHSSHSSHASHVNYGNHASTAVTGGYLGDYLNTSRTFIAYYYTYYQTYYYYYSYYFWGSHRQYTYYYTNAITVPVYYTRYYGALGEGYHYTGVYSTTYINHTNYHGTGHTNTGSSVYNYSYAKMDGALTNIAHVNTYQRNEFYQNKTKPTISWKYLSDAQIAEVHGISRALVEIKDKLNLIRFTSAGTAGTRVAKDRSGDIPSHGLEPNNTQILWRGVSQFETFRNNILQIKKDLTGLTETIAGSTIDATAVKAFKAKVDSIANIPVIVNSYNLPFHHNSPHNNHFNHNNYNNLISYSLAFQPYYVTTYGAFYTNHSNSIQYTYGYYVSYTSYSGWKTLQSNVTSISYYAYNPGPTTAYYYAYHSSYYR